MHSSPNSPLPVQTLLFMRSVITFYQHALKICSFHKTFLQVNPSPGILSLQAKSRAYLGHRRGLSKDSHWVQLAQAPSEHTSTPTKLCYKWPRRSSQEGNQTSPKVLRRVHGYLAILLLHMDHRVALPRRNLRQHHKAHSWRAMIVLNPSRTLSLVSFFFLNLKARKIPRNVCAGESITYRGTFWAPWKSPCFQPCQFILPFWEAAQICFPFEISQGSCSSCWALRSKWATFPSSSPSYN